LGCILKAVARRVAVRGILVAKTKSWQGTGSIGACGQFCRLELGPGAGRTRRLAAVTANVAEWISQALEHHRAGRFDAAELLYRRIIETDPMQREAPMLLVGVLERQGRLGDAIALFEKAILESPRAAGLYCGLADALHASGDRHRAIDAYREALARDAKLEAAWWGLGCAQATLADHAAASVSFRRLIGVRPDHGMARQNLGKSLFELGDVDGAIEAFRTAAKHVPAEAVCVPMTSIAVAIPGSPTIGNEGILEARRAWAARCLPVTSADTIPRGRAANLSRPIRLGYVSGFFAKHNWMKPVWGLIGQHDHARFEIHLFSDGPEPEARHGYRNAPHVRFHLVTGLSNAELARFIKDQEIEILIDLNAFSLPSRLPLYALRPAPIQIAWFNMFATSGSSCFDLLVGDVHVIPPEEEVFYSEKIVRVPGSYLTFQVPYSVPEVGPAPCRAGAPFAFGCLAPQYKITTEVIAAWSRILTGSPGARLVLKNAMLGRPGTLDFVREQFARHSIGADRLVLEGPAEHFEFLGRYRDIDVALDTFPYNGGTTTMEALWQGVPVLSFAGDRWAARISASLLREAGLADFVAPNLEGFIEQAIALARDLDTPLRLDTLRHGMRARLGAASVCDIARFATNMEEIYLQAWRECCEGRIMNAGRAEEQPPGR
jgi:tetratricopeptide (TPR) repeat protein